MRTTASLPKPFYGGIDDAEDGLAATAASKALPPASRMRMAASVACGFIVAAAY